jgi:hypothetical protein
MPTTSFLERDSKTEQLLGTTNDNSTAARVRMAVRTVLTPKSTQAKPVIVVAVQEKFSSYRDKYKLQPVKPGQEFPSARAASIAVGAYLGGVSVALSQARQSGNRPTATIHGVTFKLKD